MDKRFIGLAINDRETKLKDDGIISFRWYLQPTLFPEGRWWWTKGEANGLRLADDKEDGRTIATLTGDILVVEPIGSSEFDEVALAVVAIWEQRRRKDKDNDEAAAGLDAVGQIAQISEVEEPRHVG